MEDKITSLHSTFSFNGNDSNEDTRFMYITIDVLHTGLNRNGSVFTRDVVDSCLDSIRNTPVLGFLKYDDASHEYDFKGHEHILTKTENGVEEKYIGSAFGVIPESCNPRWETKMCSDGHEREFLCVDAVLWEKFSDATSIMDRDGEKAQSMELEISSVEGHNDEDGIFHFEAFRFDGCCLLGEGVMPAMVDANAQLKEVQFAAKQFIESIQDELNDKFTAFTAMVNEKNNQGGVRNMPNTDFQTLMQQFEDIANRVSQHEAMENYWGDSVPRFYAVDVQDNEVIVVDRMNNYNYYGFEFTMNGDAPEINFENATKKKISYANYEDGTIASEYSFDFGKHIANIEEVASGKLTASEEKAAEMASEFEQKTAEFEAAIAEANEKIAAFEGKIEALTSEGDEKVDAIVAEKTSEFDAQIEELTAAKSAVEEELAQVKAEYEEIKPKYDEFVQAEEQRQIEAVNALKDAKFAEFEDVLGQNEEFMALKEMRDELSVDEIEGKCAVLFYKNSLTQKNFTASDCTAATVGVFNDADNVNDGFIATKYGNIPVRK